MVGRPALRLDKETLAELSPDELAGVGGAGCPTIDECPATGTYVTLPVNYCVDYTLDQTW